MCMLSVDPTHSLNEPSLESLVYHFGRGKFAQILRHEVTRMRVDASMLDSVNIYFDFINSINVG